MLVPSIVVRGAGDDETAKINEIKLQPQIYIFGESTAPTLNEAERYARISLNENINVWLSNECGISDGNRYIAIADRKKMEINTKRGENYYRVLYYVRKTEIYPLHGDETVIVDGKPVDDLATEGTVISEVPSQESRHYVDYNPHNETDISSFAETDEPLSEPEEAVSVTVQEKGIEYYGIKRNMSAELVEEVIEEDPIVVDPEIELIEEAPEVEPVAEDSEIESEPVLTQKTDFMVNESQQNTDCQVPISDILGITLFNQFKQLCYNLKASGCLASFGKFQNMLLDKTAYVMVYDKSGKIVAHLLYDGDGGYSDIQSHSSKDIKYYSGCGAVWIRIKGMK